MEDNSEKPHEATQKRLEDARRRGEIAMSSDLTSSVAFFGLLGVAASFGPSLVERIGEVLSTLVVEAGRAGPEGQATPWPMARIVSVLSPWFLVPALGAILALTGQQAFVFAAEKLSFKGSRISPVSNAKQKFGRHGLFEFSKAAIKLLVFSTVLFFYILANLESLLTSASLEPALAATAMFSAAIEFLAVVCVLLLGVGALDYLWQRAEHLRNNRMSRKEVTDEAKEQEGDPHLKAERRARAQQVSQSTMMKDVETASVIVVNPTHYAVALWWDPSAGGAPVCVGKGVDQIAARIREIASEFGVPIHRDPPTARALFSSVAIGEEVQPELYKPVAAAIKFADKMRAKVRRAR